MDGRKTSLSPVFFYEHLKLGFYQVLKKKKIGELGNKTAKENPCNFFIKNSL